MAYDVGYEDPNYFIREFKAAFGYTPKQYRQAAKALTKDGIYGCSFPCGSSDLMATRFLNFYVRNGTDVEKAAQSAKVKFDYARWLFVLPALIIVGALLIYPIIFMSLIVFSSSWVSRKLLP